MKTRCFIYLARFINAVFILVLCGLLTAGVYADGDNHKQRIHGHNSLKLSDETRDANDLKYDSSLSNTSKLSTSYRPESKPDTSKPSSDSKDQGQAGSSKDNSQPKSGSEEHKISTAPKENNNPPSQKPDTSNESKPPANNYRPEPKPDNSKSGSEEHRVVTTPKENDNPQTQKPDANTSNSGSSQNQSNSDYRPPANTYRPDQKTDGNTPRPNDSRNSSTNNPQPPADSYHPNTSQSGSEEHRIITTPTGTVSGSPEHRIITNQKSADNDRPHNYRPPGHRERNHYYPSRPKPCHYGYWVFDNHNYDACRRSVYFSYGYFPYVQTTHVQTIPYTVPSYQSTRPALVNGYYLAKYATLLDNALMEIRDAWMTGKYELIDKHLDSSRTIAVFLDGTYDYSVTASDYADMTCDAIEEIQTVSFMWEDIKQRADSDYTAFGKHIFRNVLGDMQTVYVSYTLQKMGQDYVIIEVGASNSPLQ